MTEAEEILIYDAMAAIQRHSQALCDFINANGTSEIKEAYKSGVYAPCIKLQMLLTEEAMERGEARHERYRQQSEEYFRTLTAIDEFEEASRHSKSLICTDEATTRTTEPTEPTE